MTDDWIEKAAQEMEARRRAREQKKRARGMYQFEIGPDKLDVTYTCADERVFIPSLS